MSAQRQEKFEATAPRTAEVFYLLPVSAFAAPRPGALSLLHRMQLVWLRLAYTFTTSEWYLTAKFVVACSIKSLCWIAGFILVTNVLYVIKTSIGIDTSPGVHGHDAVPYVVDIKGPASPPPPVQ